MRRRSAEGAGVLGSIGQVEDRSVDAHQPPASKERAHGLVGGHGPSGLVEQTPQGGDAETSSGLGEGGVGGFGVIATGVKSPPDLGDRIRGEERHGDDQPDDRVGGETAAAFRGAAGS